MRRIYESDALERDDDEPLAPRERQRETKPQSFRSISGSAWSDRLLPHKLRRWAVTVEITAPDQPIPQGEDVPFQIALRNRLPMPVTIRTDSPRLWTWAVDGVQSASRVSLDRPSTEANKLKLDRGERRTIRRNWSGMFRVSKRQWEQADRGEHTIRAAVNVADPEADNLADETTVSLS
jgi:hypothetical protein